MCHQRVPRTPRDESCYGVERPDQDDRPSAESDLSRPDGTVLLLTDGLPGAIVERDRCLLHRGTSHEGYHGSVSYLTGL